MRIFQSEKICTEVFRSKKPMLLNVKQFREKYMHVCTHMYIASYFQFYFSKFEINSKSEVNEK